MIQARTGSKRLPKKVIVKIEGKPLIWHVINRVKKLEGVDNIILLTTTKKSDLILTKIALDNNIIFFRGSDKDVLKRFYNCAKKFNAENIIRITGDCPIIDPTIIKKLMNIYKSKNYDYVTNTMPPSFPDGLDVEIFSFKALEVAYLNAKKESEKEHVTPFIRKNKTMKKFNFLNKKDLSKLRWTVDEKDDLKFIRRVFSLMKPKIFFTMKDVLNMLEKNPEIIKINSNIKRNEGYIKSILRENKRIKF